jgi:hypothetical protein
VAKVKTSPSLRRKSSGGVRKINSIQRTLIKRQSINYLLMTAAELHAKKYGRITWVVFK